MTNTATRGGQSGHVHPGPTKPTHPKSTKPQVRQQKACPYVRGGHTPGVDTVHLSTPGTGLREEQTCTTRAPR